MERLMPPSQPTSSGTEPRPFLDRNAPPKEIRRALLILFGISLFLSVFVAGFGSAKFRFVSAIPASFMCDGAVLREVKIQRREGKEEIIQVFTCIDANGQRKNISGRVMLVMILFYGVLIWLLLLYAILSGKLKPEFWFQTLQEAPPPTQPSLTWEEHHAQQQTQQESKVSEWHEQGVRPAPLATLSELPQTTLDANNAPSFAALDSHDDAPVSEREGPQSIEIAGFSEFDGLAGRFAPPSYPSMLGTPPVQSAPQEDPWSHLQPKAAATPSHTNDAPEAPQPVTPRTVLERLADLDKLRASTLMPADEYYARRDEIIRSL